MKIDLRSDTVTQPTPAMKEAMFNAPLGDDVFGDDPSVIELEQVAAQLFGMEAAIFCASGTMANQIAIKVHTNAPGEVICDKLSHIYQYEGGGIGFNSGLATHLLEGNRGRLSAAQIAEAIRVEDIHFAETQLISLENTCNKGGGSIYEIEELKKINSLCSTQNIPLHLDGARVFNALIESNYSAKDLGGIFDSISVCLSKGLAAPVGSVLLGSSSFIKKSRRLRKIFGGGMRQAGLLAKGGTYALQNHIERLKEDHQKAQILAQELTKITYVKTVLPADTNIVVLELNPKVNYLNIIQQLADYNILVSPFGNNRIRLVTHLDFTADMLEYTIKILQKIA